MKIAADSVTLAASHTASSHQTIRESLRAWVGDHRPDFEGREKAGAAAAVGASITSISAAGLSAAQAEAAAPQPGSAQAIDDAADAAEHDPHLSLLLAVVEMLTGHKIRLMHLSDMQPDAPPVETQSPDSASEQAAQAPKRAGFGIEYDRHDVRDESEPGGDCNDK